MPSGGERHSSGFYGKGQQNREKVEREPLPRGFWKSISLFTSHIVTLMIEFDVIIFDSINSQL